MLPSDKKPETAEIFAAQKIIADISSGLYRSPAAALKELVSNAYDADAEKVIIGTDAPQFRTLVIHDDGAGMLIKDFLNVISHIGGSRKRIIGGDVTSKGRKIIGRIGIGMLAIAQLGYRFYVASSVKGNPTRFIAEVDLEPFHKDDAALVSMGRMKENSDEVRIGAVKYVDNIPEDEGVHYTVITIPDAKQGLISEITGAVRKAVGAKEKLSVKEELIDNFDKLIDITRSSKRADIDLDGYYYMLWELAQLCPINYSEQGPFETSQREIEGVETIDLPSVKDFQVFVDGIELRRPQLFPSKGAFNYSGPIPKIYPIEFDRQISGRQLQFSGYIYSQQPRIDPEEFRGVHIRIRHVGIGKYDRTWLGYPFDEGIKFGQITGEIYVEDGLESALNIDRDSFKETDVHYQALRAFLWDKLRTKVFPDFKLRQKNFSNEKRTQERNIQEEKFTEKLLQLPAPLLVEKEKYTTHIETPTVSTWIEADEKSLNFEKTNWKRFIDETELTSQEAKDRFIRVLKVLISNELLIEMTEEEIEPLLQALAVAVQ